MMQSSIHHKVIMKKIVWEYPERILPLCYCAIFMAHCYHIL